MPTPLQRRLTSNVIEFTARYRSVLPMGEPRPRWHFVAWSMLCFLLGVILRDVIAFTA